MSTFKGAAGLVGRPLAESDNYKMKVGVLVKEIQPQGVAKGDSNGYGEFEVRLGQHTIKPRPSKSKSICTQ